MVGSFGGACFGPPGAFSRNLEKLSKSSYSLFHPGPQNVVKVVPGGLVQQSKSITTPKKRKDGQSLVEKLNFSEVFGSLGHRSSIGLTRS